MRGLYTTDIDLDNIIQDCQNIINLNLNSELAVFVTLKRCDFFAIIILFTD